MLFKYYFIRNCNNVNIVMLVKLFPYWGIQNSGQSFSPMDTEIKSHLEKEYEFFEQVLSISHVAPLSNLHNS